MGITNIGVLFDEENFGSPVLGDLRIAVTTNAQLTPRYVDNTLALQVDVVTDAQIGLIKKISHISLTINVTTNAVVGTFILRTVPVTAKLSSYTITPAIATHTEYASDNLISQFKQCPNIENLISGPLLEVDQAQTDVFDFQEQIINIEEAEGVNLDICGAIVGKARFTNRPDNSYRNEIITQVFVNNCDGTLTKILSTLITLYNLEPGISVLPTLQLMTKTHNRIQVYIRDESFLDVNGGKEAVQQLVAAGALAQIVVNDRETELGNYFSFDSVDGDNDTLGNGWGSVDDLSLGGELVGTYNIEDFFNEGGQSTGTPLLTTTKLIPVETFA